MSVSELVAPEAAVFVDRCELEECGLGDCNLCTVAYAC